MRKFQYLHKLRKWLFPQQHEHLRTSINLQLELGLFRKRKFTILC